MADLTNIFLSINIRAQNFVSEILFVTEKLFFAHKVYNFYELNFKQKINREILLLREERKQSLRHPIYQKHGNFIEL